jgi:hypothetical protein
MKLPVIAAILKSHPSSDNDCLHLSIENPPYMRLVIEDIGFGPNNRPAIRETLGRVKASLKEGGLVVIENSCFSAQIQLGKTGPFWHMTSCVTILHESLPQVLIAQTSNRFALVFL